MSKGTLLLLLVVVAALAASGLGLFTRYRPLGFSDGH